MEKNSLEVAMGEETLIPAADTEAVGNMESWWENHEWGQRSGRHTQKKRWRVEEDLLTDLLGRFTPISER